MEFLLKKVLLRSVRKTDVPLQVQCYTKSICAGAQNLPEISAEHHFPIRHSRLPLHQAAKAITGYLAQSQFVLTSFTTKAASFTNH